MIFRRAMDDETCIQIYNSAQFRKRDRCRGALPWQMQKLLLLSGHQNRSMSGNSIKDASLQLWTSFRLHVGVQCPCTEGMKSIYHLPSVQLYFSFLLTRPVYWQGFLLAFLDHEPLQEYVTKQNDFDWNQPVLTSPLFSLEVFCCYVRVPKETVPNHFCKRSDFCWIGRHRKWMASVFGWGGKKRGLDGRCWSSYKEFAV